MVSLCSLDAQSAEGCSGRVAGRTRGIQRWTIYRALQSLTVTACTDPDMGRRRLAAQMDGKPQATERVGGDGSGLAAIAPALDPIIKALSEPEERTIGTEQARRLLGIKSVIAVKRWIDLRILPGRWDERSGRWQIALSDVLPLRDTQATLSDAGGEDLAEEELDLFSATRPGTYPFTRLRDRTLDAGITA